VKHVKIFCGEGQEELQSRIDYYSDECEGIPIDVAVAQSEDEHAVRITVAVLYEII